MMVGGLVMVLVPAALIGLVVWAIAAARPRETPRDVAQNPLDIAKARYARGEITREEFEQIKTDLTS